MAHLALGCIGILKKNRQTTIVYWGLCRGYLAKMERNMETHKDDATSLSGGHNRGTRNPKPQILNPKP